jgi:hypothetical protein
MADADIDETAAGDGAVIEDEAEDQAAIAERKLARAVAIGLPLATLAGFAGVSWLFGLAPGILVLVGGGLVGVIAILWGSLRVLAGDAALPPEIEALDAGAHTVDHLAIRKRMLIRSLKDLDNEKALGKLEPEDHDALAAVARAELKEVLRRMDESLAPFRKNAEALAASFLAQQEQGVAGAAKARAASAASEAAPRATPDASGATRAGCAACGASNEPDARFCKACGMAIGADAATTTPTTEKTDDEA